MLSVWLKFVSYTEMESVMPHYESLISLLQLLICFLLDFSVSNRKRLKEGMGTVSF